MNKTNNADLKLILGAALKFLLLSLLILLVPVAVYIDIVVLGHGMPESSLTEYCQEGLLLLSSIVFFALAYRNQNKRGFATLVGGFFSVMLIREMDGVFDKITHGFWIYPAVVWTVVVLLIAARFRDGILAAMASATRSGSFAYIIVGLAIVLSFSRVFGTTSLWRAILEGDEAVKLVKATIQEGLELLGYVLIAFGSIGYCREVCEACSAEPPVAKINTAGE